MEKMEVDDVPLGDEDFESVSVDVNPLQFLTSDTHPLLLTKIFSNLKVDDLKNCRLVSRFWDKEALPVLSQRSRIKELMLTFPQNVHEKSRNVTVVVVAVCHSKNESKIQRLMQMLENASRPDLLLKNMIIIIPLPPATPSLTDLLQKYGKYFQSLILFTKDEPYLHHILTTFCPNLKHLQTSLEEDIDYSHFQINQELKLEEIDILDISDEENSGRKFLVNSVIRNSPALKTVTFDVENADPAEIYKELEPFLPAIASKWESFSCTLPLIDIDEKKEQDPFLKLFKSLINLRKLTIQGMETDDNESINIEVRNQWEFLDLRKKFISPAMQRNLTHLTLKNIEVIQIPDQIAPLIQSFPNLESLTVRMYKDNRIPKQFSIGIAVLKETPMIKMKKITLEEEFYDIHSPKTASYFVKAFPNLESVSIMLNRRDHFAVGDEKRKRHPKRGKLQDVVPAFAELKKLQNLHIVAYTEKSTEVPDSLLFIPDYPSLKTLTIEIVGDWDLTPVRLRQNFINTMMNFRKIKAEIKRRKIQLSTAAMKKPLLAVRHLKLVLLQNFKMLLKHESEVNAFAIENKIPLKYYGWESQLGMET